MNIGLSFSIFGRRPFVVGAQANVPDESCFAQCSEHGIRQVEVTIMEGDFLPDNTAVIENVGRLADAYGITIHSVHGHFGWPTNGHWLGDPDKAARRRNVAERILALEGTAVLNARYMVVELEAYDQWPFWPHGQQPQSVYRRAWDQRK